MARLTTPVHYAATPLATWQRRSVRGVLAMPTALALLLANTPARAQQVDPRETQARSECLAGRFQAGVDLLAQLFAETANANYIYNQGRCYEQNGKPDEAVLRFREFLRKAKILSAEAKAEVNGHIAECQAMKAEQEGRAAPATTVPVPPSSPGTPPSTAEAQPEPPTTITPAPDKPIATPSSAGLVETGRPSTDSRGATLRTAGIVAASIGAAGLIAGVAFSIETHSISSDVTSNASHRSFSRTTYDRGSLFSDLQWVGYGVGALALACGGVLYYFGYRAGHAPASDSVSLAPMLLPGGTGAVVHGSF
jgi:hypothetical protein